MWYQPCCVKETEREWGGCWGSLCFAPLHLPPSALCLPSLYCFPSRGWPTTVSARRHLDLVLAEHSGPPSPQLYQLTILRSASPSSILRAGHWPHEAENTEQLTPPTTHLPGGQDFLHTCKLTVVRLFPYTDPHPCPPTTAGEHSGRQKSLPPQTRLSSPSSGKFQLLMAAFPFLTSFSFFPCFWGFLITTNNYFCVKSCRLNIDDQPRDKKESETVCWFRTAAKCFPVQQVSSGFLPLHTHNPLPSLLPVPLQPELMTPRA